MSWAHLAFDPVNIELTISKNQIEDLFFVRVSRCLKWDIRGHVFGVSV